MSAVPRGLLAASGLVLLASAARAEVATSSVSRTATAAAEAAATASTAPGNLAGDAVLTPLVVRSSAGRRSASEVVRDRAVLQAAPHRSTDELLFTVPGVFITQHSGEGKAYQIFYRGFDAVHGQDLEIWAAGAPVNDVSNVHGQGYADLHFLPTEVVRELVALPGTYDPRQGDFAVAGSLRLEVGLDQPGFTAKAELGQFGTRRLFLAYRPESAGESTFAAVEVYHTGGFGPSRAAERASAVAQWLQSLGGGTELRLFASAYTGRFSSAGVLRLSDVESKAVDRFDTYDPTQGGASSRVQVVAELRRREEKARWAFSPYVVLRTLRLRQNFTGYLVSASGDSEQQLDDDLVVGAHGYYRRTLRLVSPKDSLEVGFFTRADWIEQSQRRLSVVDGSVTADEVDARVRAFDVAAYADLALEPFDFLAVRGGVRVDGLGYFAEDQGGAASGQSRASQGAHAGGKATLDFKLHQRVHALLSYGGGFRSPQARSLQEGETTPFTRVHSGELGFRFALPRLSISLAGFATVLSDDLVFDQATARNERVPSTRRLGGALDVSAPLFEGLTLSAGATFTVAQFTASSAMYGEGDLVPYVPQGVLRVDAGYKRELGEVLDLPISARVGAALSSLLRRPLPYQQLGSDIALVDATAAVTVGPAELGVEIFNLFDSNWYDGEFVFASRWRPNEAAALVPQRHVTAGAPRTVLASLTVRI